MKISDLLNYSISNNLKHIPSALSQFSYLKYLLPLIKKDFNIVIGKPFGSQAYYTIWEDMGYIIPGQKLSYGVKHDELRFVNYSEETLGNALGIASGIALSSNKLTWCNISDGALQMGPTLEAIQFIGAKQLPVLLTIDYNNMQLTGSTSDILNIDSSKIKSLFKTFNWKIITISFIGNICPIQRTKKLKKIIQYFNILQRPLVIICKTKKGSGVKEMEDDSIGWHYKSLDHLDSVTIKI